MTKATVKLTKEKALREAIRRLAIKQLREIKVFGQSKVIPLSKLPADVAKLAVSNGRNDNDQFDDVVMSKKAKIPVKDLKPAQKEVIKEKALGMAIDFLTKGKWDGVDLKAIISSDNYIMDGHHRWAAVSLIDPKAEIRGTVINLPGVSLVSVLNIVTKAMGKSGNEGEGDVKTFTGKALEPIITDAIENGIKGQYPITPEAVKAAIVKVPGSNGDVEKAKQIMMQNADLLSKKVMPGAPSRVDMPVIGPEEVSKIATAIKNGVVDFTKPYSSAVSDKIVQEVLVNKGEKALREAIRRLAIKQLREIKALREGEDEEVEKEQQPEEEVEAGLEDDFQSAVDVFTRKISLSRQTPTNEDLIDMLSQVVERFTTTSEERLSLLKGIRDITIH